MSSAVIRVENLGKLYRIGERVPYFTLRDVLSRAVTAPLNNLKPQSNSSVKNGASEVWALKDVSFEVGQGEVIGIIGRNGAGKSTLLKILSRVTRPTLGHAQICGRMGSLLEVGTGFHRELTGRENTYMNGAILGMSKRDIDRRFDEIVAFAEIEKFIDTPVKHYSSGMHARLAFSVAAHLEPEILLVDEVLAVGDVAFQKKCLGRMGDSAKEGRTVLFVSHNMSAVAMLCKSAIVMETGRVKTMGNVQQAIAKYLETGVDRNTIIHHLEGVPRHDPSLHQEVEFLTLSLDECPTKLVPADADITMLITVRGNQTVRNFSFYLTVYASDGAPVGSCSGEETHSIQNGETGIYSLRLPNPRLAPGYYRIDLGVGTGNERTGFREFDATSPVLDFEIMAPPGVDGTISEWQKGWGTVRFPKLISKACD
jgi:ABC-type polysaccharide/polyol phosphate transport system, ATPase component